jgi:hypothetical protein
MSQPASPSIAETVLAQFRATHVVAVPEGQVAAAVSHRKSSDLSDPRRSLHLIFADGSDIGIHGAEVIAASEAGEVYPIERREAAFKIAPELNDQARPLPSLVTDVMVKAAMQSSIETGLIQGNADADAFVANLPLVKAMLQAAIDAAEGK